MSDERTQPGGPADPVEPTGPSDPGRPPEWPSAPDSHAGDPTPASGPPQWPAAGHAPPQWPAPPPAAPQAGPSGVHPLDVGRAFSVAWSLFRFRWKALLGSAFAIMLPAYVIQVALTVLVADSMERWLAALQEAMFALDPGEQLGFGDLPPFPVEAVLASIAAGILVSIAGIVVGAALVHIIGWTYGGAKASAGAALRASLARLPSLVGAGLLVGLVILLVVFGGVVLMLAMFAAVGFEPGPLTLLGLIVIVATFAAVLFLGIRWMFYTQAIMLEGARAIESLGRSWRLVSGSGWRVLGYLLLLSLVLFIVGLIISVVVLAIFGLGVDMTTGQPLPYDPVRSSGQTLLTGLGTLLVLPFYMAVLTLLYYDLRWRRQEQIGPPPA